MNIALFVSPRHTVPSRDDTRSVPWDMAEYLADGLTELGNPVGKLIGIRAHSVFLYAAQQSHTKAVLRNAGIEAVDARRQSLSASDYRDAVSAAEEQLFTAMVTEIDERKIDILHIIDPAESLAEVIIRHKPAIPIVVTLHDILTSSRLSGLEKLAGIPGVFLITTSNAQRDGFRLPFYATVYTGVHLEDFTYVATSGQTFIMTGRISPEKGYEDAISAITNSGNRLVIAGKIYQHMVAEDSYFRATLEPKLREANIGMHQYLSRRELNAFYGDARAILYPIGWDEPYGVSVIESLACGTPVIAYDRGFIPEVIEDGVNGYIVSPDRNSATVRIIQEKGIAGLVSAMGKISGIKREMCRATVENKFSTHAMVLSYETVYKNILKKQ